MAFEPTRAKTEFIRLPIPELSAIQKPASTYEGIPVAGCPQSMQSFPRKA